MASCTLLKTLRRVPVFTREIFSINYSTQHQKCLDNCNPFFFFADKKLNNYTNFTPKIVNTKFDISKNNLPLSKIIECPVLPNFQVIDPVKIEIIKNDIKPDKVIEMPLTNIIEKRAERMITIRKRKMKKHKKRKFLKRMKFVIRKREHKIKTLKEKEFQKKLEGIYLEAESFDAKKFVDERIHLLTKKRLPNKWRGEVVPEAMIKQFIKEAEERKAHKLRINTYRLKLDD